MTKQRKPNNGAQQQLHELELRWKLHRNFLVDTKFCAAQLKYIGSAYFTFGFKKSYFRFGEIYVNKTFTNVFSLMYIYKCRKEILKNIFSLTCKQFFRDNAFPVWLRISKPLLSNAAWKPRSGKVHISAEERS